MGHVYYPAIDQQLSRMLDTQHGLERSLSRDGYMTHLFYFASNRLLLTLPLL